ncbi:universal stress protein (plasmid) [Haloferacaceae archaeon DSL9]
MKRPLVVTDPNDSVVDVVREAGELATAVDAPLCVLTVLTADEYENDAEVLGAIDRVERSNFSPEPEVYAEKIAQTAIADLLSDLELETKAIGRYVERESDRADAIVRTAEKNDCDYIFLLRRQRSPTGKAIFGDTAQSVILNFDDYVVTVAE